MIHRAITASGSVDALPDSVALQHTEDPPDFDYESHGLRDDKNDHRVVATALSLQGDGERVVLAAGDVGPRILAEKRGLECLDLADYRIATLSPAEKRYLRAKHRLRNMHRRLVRLDLAARNEGKAPATNLEIVLEIPDGPVPCSADDLPPEELDEPKPPREPRTVLERSLATPTNIGHILAGTDVSDAVPSPKKSRGWDIEEVNSYRLTREIERIRQQRSVSLDPLWILFPSDVEARSFSITYRIVADPVPGETTDDLHFVVRRPGE